MVLNPGGSTLHMLPHWTVHVDAFDRDARAGGEGIAAPGGPYALVTGSAGRWLYWLSGPAITAYSLVGHTLDDGMKERLPGQSADSRSLAVHPTGTVLYVGARGSSDAGPQSSIVAYDITRGLPALLRSLILPPESAP